MSAAMEEEIEPELVQPTEFMSTELFAVHMEYRHPESLAGMIPLWFSSDYVEKCYRTFHKTLHRLRVSIFYDKLDHYHGDEE